MLSCKKSMAPYRIALVIFLQFLFCKSILASGSVPARCAVASNASKVECGHYGISSDDCDMRGCCFEACYACGYRTPFCYDPIVLPPDSKDGEIRLVGPEAPVRGRLEIYHSGVWGVICDNKFTMTEAVVACRQLGYTAEKNMTASLAKHDWKPPYSGHHKIPKGDHQILLNDVKCQKSAQRLVDCEHSDWFKHECYYAEFVHIDCDAKMEVRLKDNRLEVNRYGKWGTVCNRGFGLKEARTACRDMGLNPDGAELLPVPSNLPDEAPYHIYGIWMDKVNCTEGAKHLLECDYPEWDTNYDCWHDQDVYMKC